jgi:hypothetical protein
MCRRVPQHKSKDQQFPSLGASGKIANDNEVYKSGLLSIQDSESHSQRTRHFDVRVHTESWRAASSVEP